jgi:hypothetical protein
VNFVLEDNPYGRLRSKHVGSRQVCTRRGTPCLPWDFLDAALPKQGHGSFEDVEAIVLESTASISVITAENFKDGTSLDILREDEADGT